MNTDSYLNKHVQQQPFSKIGFIDQASLFIRNHSTLVKAIEIAALILGAAAALAAPIYLPVAIATTISISCAVFAVAALVALCTLDLIITPPLEIENHTFDLAECRGSRLYYQGDVPILEIKGNSAHDSGFAYGYLLAKPMEKMRSNWSFFLHTLLRQPTANEMPTIIEEIWQKLPQKYQEEMKGVVNGFNQWIEENPSCNCSKITLEELIAFQLIPDIAHFKRERAENLRLLDAIPVTGCTAVVDRDKDEGITFGRNMDWISLGINGTYTFVIKRYENGKMKTMEVALPGLLGTATGMTANGLCLAMNVCIGETEEVRGLPAVLFNRICLDTATSVEAVENIVKNSSPLGPYHLIVADPNCAKSIHFYQAEDETHFTRELEEDNPLIITNCRYSEAGQSQHKGRSEEREEVLAAFFQDARGQISPEQLEKRKLVAHSLTLPYVNNAITTYTVHMQPETQTFKLNFDNGFSALKEPQIVEF